MALFLMAFINFNNRVLHIKRLIGFSESATYTQLHWATWWDGTYQNQTEKYLNDHVPNRPWLVRPVEQIDYSFFNLCHAGWTIKGKDNYLFQYPYTDAYIGADFLGYDSLFKKTLELKAIQDTLNRLHIKLVMVFSPSKASFFPEYFPDSYLKTPGPTNDSVFKKYYDSLGIKYLDFDKWFVSLKHSCKEMLFNKQGVHFTTYGTMLCADSLRRFLQNDAKIEVPIPEWGPVTHSYHLQNGDDDVASELNLIFPIAHELGAYPAYKPMTATSGKKLNLVLLGDSYALKMVDVAYFYQSFDKFEFWSLFNEVVNYKEHTWSKMDGYDWATALTKYDYLVIAFTPFNYRAMGADFIEKAYAHYYPNGTCQH